MDNVGGDTIVELTEEDTQESALNRIKGYRNDLNKAIACSIREFEQDTGMAVHDLAIERPSIGNSNIIVKSVVFLPP